MKDYIECIPVMLPQKDLHNVAIGSIMKLTDCDDTPYLWLLPYTGDTSYHPDIPHHLYLVSDREIKKEWIGVAYKSDVVGKVFRHFYTTNPWYNDAKIVEATTDPSLGLPLIPQSFIEEYVQKKGKIDKVMVKLHDVLGILDQNVPDKSKTPIEQWNSREVIILPIKDSWNRDELKGIQKEYGNYLNEGGVFYFDEWFDKNY